MADVRLRPLREDDIEALLAERGDGTAPGSSESRARSGLQAAVARGAELDRGRLDLVVEENGRLVGHVEARQPEGAMPAGVFEIGISMFADARGRGLGREAVRLFTDLLMLEYAAYRVQASTELANASMRAVLEGLGYTLEGVLRGFMPTEDGGRADYALYAVIRPDWLGVEARAPTSRR